MRVHAEINAIGVEIPLAHQVPGVLSIAPATYKVRLRSGGRISKPGTRIHVDKMTSWARREEACGLSRLIVSAALDLATRVPARVDVWVRVGRRECEPPVLSAPRPYELLGWSSSADVLPYVVRLTENGVRQMADFITCALDRDVSVLWPMAVGFAAADRAARGVEPMERVVALWTGIEALTPGGVRGVLAWIDGVEATTPGFRRALLQVASQDTATVLRARRRLAVLPGTHSSLATRLGADVRRQQQRVEVAIAGICAIRNAVVHGSIAASDSKEIETARAADTLGWLLLSARILELVCGSPRLPELVASAVAITL